MVNDFVERRFHTFYMRLLVYMALFLRSTGKTTVPNLKPLALIVVIFSDTSQNIVMILRQLSAIECQTDSVIRPNVMIPPHFHTIIRISVS